MGDPIIPPPAEPSEEFLNQYNGQRLVAAAVVLIALTTVFVTLRFWSDKRLVSRWFADDILIFVSYVLFMAQCATMVAMVKVGGAGHHIIALQRQEGPQVLVRWRGLLLAYLLLLYFVIILPRLSLLSLYLRVFGWQRRSRIVERTVSFVLMGLFIIILGMLLGFTLAACRPLGFMQQYTLSSGDCGRFLYFFRTQMIVGIVFDVLVFILPLRTIWALKIPVSDRITVALFFSLASFGVIVWTIIRVVASYHGTYSIDGTYAGVSLSIWYSVEAGYYIMANCLSRIRPILVMILPISFINLWRASMTSLGGMPGAPHFVPSLQTRERPSRKSSRKNDEADHEEREGDTGEATETGESESDGQETKLVTGKLVSMSFMDDPYLLGFTPGSTWSIVREPRRPSAVKSVPADGEIQVTVQVETCTAPRPLGRRYRR